jgi:hypothetical protein
VSKRWERNDWYDANGVNLTLKAEMEQRREYESQFFIGEPYEWLSNDILNCSDDCPLIESCIEKVSYEHDRARSRAKYKGLTANSVRGWVNRNYDENGNYNGAYDEKTKKYNEV